MLEIKRKSDVSIHIIAFFLITTVMFFSPIYRGGKITLLLVVNCLLFLKLKTYRVIKKRDFLLISYLVIFYLLTLLSTINKEMTTYFFLTIIFFILNYLSFYKYFIEKKKNYYRVLDLICFLGNIIMFYSLIEHFIGYNPIFCNLFPDPYKTSYSIPSYIIYRINGSVGQPVPFSSFSIFMIFINYMQFAVKEKKRYLGFVLISVLSLIFTYTRSAYIAVAISIVFAFIIYILKNMKIRLKHVVIGTGLLIGLMIAGIFLLPKQGDVFVSIINRFSNVSKDVSFNQRSIGIGFVLTSLQDNFKNFIFGYGVGNLLNIRNYYNLEFFIDNFYALDNQYFTFLFEYGIIGGLVMIGYLKKFFKIFVKNINSRKMRILCCSLLSLLICQFFYDATYWIITLFFIAINISMIHYTYEQGEVNE